MADFGLAEDMYGSNYYRHSRSEGGERVPIRWMAPESIDTNIYNEATDVVCALVETMIHDTLVCSRKSLIKNTIHQTSIED